MAKRIRVSTDNITWYTLPGASGELAVEMASVDDTIFGQDWQSENPSIGGWNVTGAAFYKGVAGYTVDILGSGVAVPVTDEATTTIVANETYQITATARRVMDLAAAVTVEDNAVLVDADDIASIDYLSGIITFVGGYTATGPITVNYSYLPMAVLGCGRSFNLTQTAAEIDATCYDAAQANGGWRVNQYGLKTASLELGNVWKSTTDFIDTLVARAAVFISISPNDTAGTGTTEVVARGIFKYMGDTMSGDVGALEEESLNFSLSVPDSEVLEYPFHWYFGATASISPAVKLCLEAWQDGTTIYVEYSPDGTVGKTGQAIVTEASLANSFDGQNEFSFTFLGTGVISDI